LAAVSRTEVSHGESPLILSTSTGDLVGTLTIPNQSGTFPVALIIAGSGPTDRDGNNPTMKNNSLKLLAEAFARNGIASLRYDKRGIGESREAAMSEADLRFDDFVEDARGWIALLKKDKRFSGIIIVGHSEGSLIGMLSCENADKYVSIAGAGQSADVILKTQLSAQPQGIQDLSFPILDSLKAGKTVGTVNPMLHSLFRPSVQPYMISWFQYNPQVEIRKLSIPVLVVQGTNDVQVSVDDAERLHTANTTAELALIDNMNHLLKIVHGSIQDNLATYNNPDLPISDQLVERVVNFILERD
jgi:alpha-beta hydrolase superfamily lysophospholipase